MTWEQGEHNAGFSPAEPWLPVPQEHKDLAVSTQQGDQNSLLEFYRQFIHFRRTQRPLIKGKLDNIQLEGNIVGFVRTHGNESLYCAFNLGADAGHITIEQDRSLTLLESPNSIPTLQNKSLTLPALSTAYIHLG